MRGIFVIHTGRSSVLPSIANMAVGCKETLLNVMSRQGHVLLDVSVGIYRDVIVKTMELDKSRGRPTRVSSDKCTSRLPSR